MMFPQRIAYAGAAEWDGAAMQVSGTLGGVASVVRNGVGDYTVSLKAPGVPGYSLHACVPLATAHSSSPTFVGLTMPNSTTLNVFTFDDSGAAADRTFTFAIVLTERLGVAP